MNKLINYPVVILCGGKSSRMKEDKSQLPFNGFNTLAEYQYTKLQKYFKDVYISSKEDKFDFLEDKSKLILDNSTTYSPMVALQKILKSFNENYVFIIAVDIPFIKESTLKELNQELEDKDVQIIVPVDSDGYRHNLCGFYHTSVVNVIDGLIEKDIHKIGALVQKVNSKELEVKEAEQFLNLNEQIDYKKACTLFSSFSI